MQRGGTGAEIGWESFFFFTFIFVFIFVTSPRIMGVYRMDEGTETLKGLLHHPWISYRFPSSSSSPLRQLAG